MASRYPTKQTPIAQLQPNKGQIEGVPKNPRFIRDDKFKKLVQSIKDDPEMLELRELVAYDNHGKGLVIIMGNMRYRAMKEIGYTEAPCKVLPPDTPVEKLRAFALKDNSNYGEWDIDDLLNEWDEQELIAAAIEIPDIPNPEAEEEEAKEDNFEPEPPGDPTSKLGDIWQLGQHRLICGDSTKQETVTALMGEEMADLLLTDPPYNVAYKAKGKKAIENDDMSDANFVAFLEAAYRAADSVMKPGAGFYIWHADNRRESFLEALHAVPWTLRQALVWNKNSITLGRQDYQWKHEPCLYGWKDGAAHYFIDRRNLTTVIEQQLEDIDNLTKAEMKEILLKLRDEMPTTVIDCDKPAKSELHPTMKPVPLIGRQVRNSSRRGDIVLDIFGGSGTTLIACEQLGRRCRMVEYDPAYVDVIVRRWEELTGKQAQLLTSGNKSRQEANVQQTTAK